MHLDGIGDFLWGLLEFVGEALGSIEHHGSASPSWKRSFFMRRWLRRLSVFVATVGFSSATFETILKLEMPGWKSTEHLAIVVWSMPLGFPILGSARLLWPLVRGRSRIVRGLTVAVVAALVAIAWTTAAIWLTGGYALAFDASPLWCWFMGSLAGLSTAFFWPWPASESVVGAAAT